MEKQIPSRIPQIASLPTSHESRNIGLSLPKQVNLNNGFACIFNVAAVQHVPHEVEAMHSDSRAAAVLSSSKDRDRRRCSNSLSEMARSGSCMFIPDKMCAKVDGGWKI